MVVTLKNLKEDYTNAVTQVLTESFGLSEDAANDLFVAISQDNFDEFALNDSYTLYTNGVQGSFWVFDKDRKTSNTPKANKVNTHLVTLLTALQKAQAAFTK